MTPISSSEQVSSSEPISGGEPTPGEQSWRNRETAHEGWVSPSFVSQRNGSQGATRIAKPEIGTIGASETVVGSTSAGDTSTGGTSTGDTSTGDTSTAGRRAGRQDLPLRPLGFPLAPMGIIEMLDGAFGLIRSRFALLVSLAVTFVAPLYVPVVLSGRESSASWLSTWWQQVDHIDSGVSTPLPGFGWSVASTLMASLSTMLVGMAMAAVVHESLAGRGVSYLGALRLVVRRLPAALPVWALSRVLISIGLAMCLLPGIIMSVGFMLSAPIVMFERRSAFSPVGRSFSMCASRSGPAFAVALSAGLLSALLSLCLTTVVQVAVMMVSSSGEVDWAWIALSVVGFIGIVLASMIAGTVATVLYVDRRCRLEGWDLERKMVRSFGAVAP